MLGKVITVYLIIILILIYYYKIECISDIELKYKAYSKNNNRAKDFPCKVPQKRAILYTKIFTKDIYSYQRVEPRMTILHRCDEESGYCSHPNCVCAPAKWENISLVFMLGQTEYHEQFVINHTKCECREEQSPK